MSLASQHCQPCRGDSLPASPAEQVAYLAELPGWSRVEVAGIDHLVRAYAFHSYGDGLAFAQRLGNLADQEDHHPTLIIEWRKVTVQWWTHAIRGLHHNDFVMAAKSDALYQTFA